jgi:hypothetical protein
MSNNDGEQVNKICAAPLAGALVYTCLVALQSHIVHKVATVIQSDHLLPDDKSEGRSLLAKPGESIPVYENKVFVVDIDDNVSSSRLSVDQPTWFV